MPTLPSFTVFDTETTGLDPSKGHKIIEIAGIRIEDGQILDDKPFVQLVNPEREIPWEAKRVNHISDEEVCDAPTIDQVLPKFLEFAKGSILVAHNAAFDMGFMKHEKEHCWGYIDLPECLCTMKLSRNLFPSEFRHSLDIVAQRLKLNIPENRHRALPDVLLTANALLAMLTQNNIQTLEDLRKAASWKQLVM